MAKIIMVNPFSTSKLNAFLTWKVLILEHRVGTKL